MLIAILSGFLFSFSLFFIGKWVKRGFAIWTTLLPLSLLIYFCRYIPNILNGDVIRQTYYWVPSFGLNLTFNLDGVSLLFALMITLIGSLVFLYTSSYLKGHPYLDRFYAYLSVFMGAMLGLVLSDNLLAIFLFWELTSISSYFLIGFNNEDRASRQSAIIALSVTGIGGLLLFVAVILLAMTGHSYQLHELIQLKTDIVSSPYYTTILILIFGAAFTKSAQFPFHFWLPGAMKAPTPVSTYLHSATMVKAGIYLLLRMSPLLSGTLLWNGTLIAIGSITMIYAAFHTLFRIDLKSILAYSTISALGILTFLIGIGTPKSIWAALIFIIVHASYKSTLFLVTGIIDHETGTRDVTHLSGLRKVTLPVAIAGLLAAISNAGIPPAIGFIGKEAIYESTLDVKFWKYLPYLLTFTAVLTNALLFFAGFVAGLSPFKGRLPQNFEKVHCPPIVMWIPPMIMGILGFVLGCFPFLVEGLLSQSMLAVGLPHSEHLSLWHGFSTVLILSAVTIAVGAVLYCFMKPSHQKLHIIQRFEQVSPENITVLIASIFQKASLKITQLFQNGYLRKYVFTIIVFSTFLLGLSLFSGREYQLSIEAFKDITLYEITVVFVMIIGIFFAVFSKSRLIAIASLGFIGFSFCMFFVIYGAPDLALTQFSIDTLTVILFVLVMYKLPRYLKIYDKRNWWKHLLVSLVFGMVITLIALETLTVNRNTEVSDFYSKNSYLLAHGKNVVNVILVDFRGADTMMEITVLTIAAIGVFALIKLRLKTWDRFKA